MSLEYPENCTVRQHERLELVMAEAGAVSLCSGFGPRFDTERTPENIERWERAVNACGGQASDACVECPARTQLSTITNEQE